MRLAVIADIHGNSFALEAVLEDLAKQAVDELVVAGDLVNLHPHARQTWEILGGLGATLLQGNHEQYLYSWQPPANPIPPSQDRFGPVGWCAAQFSPTERAQMQALPWFYQQPGLLIAHASQRSLSDNVGLDTAGETLEASFPTLRPPCIVRGHNHTWSTVNWKHGQIHTINACGWAFGVGPVAPYALLTHTSSGWKLQQRHVPYNHAAAVAVMDEAYIEQVGPLGRIFKHELQQCAVQIHPFLHRYGAALEAGQISLEAAVEGYLNRG